MGSIFDDDERYDNNLFDDEPFDNKEFLDWLDEITENKERYREIPISPEGFVIVSLSIVFFILLSRILFH